MQKKSLLRKKYLTIRKKKYFDIKPSFFSPLIKFIKKKSKKKYVLLSSFYPSSFEVNTLKLFETEFISKLEILLPVLNGNNMMYFHKWKRNDVLKINRFGMLEPALLSGHIVPDIMLVPLLAYDSKNNRLGYGGGYYDRYINKYTKIHKNILTIGIAFSFQKHHKIPVFNNDIKLNYVLTEKGISNLK